MYEKPSMKIYSVEDVINIKANASSSVCTGGSVGTNTCQGGSVGINMGGCSCGPGKSTCHGNITSEP